MLLDVTDPMLMYLVVDVENHNINEEEAPMMIQRGSVSPWCSIVEQFVIDVQDDFAVKDVT